MSGMWLVFQRIVGSPRFRFCGVFVRRDGREEELALDKYHGPAGRTKGREFQAAALPNFLRRSIKPKNFKP
jgi:hypothetical protein